MLDRCCCWSMLRVWTICSFDLWTVSREYILYPILWTVNTTEGSRKPWMKLLQRIYAFRITHERNRMWSCSGNETSKELDLICIRTYLHKGRYWTKFCQSLVAKFTLSNWGITHGYILNPSIFPDPASFLYPASEETPQPTSSKKVSGGMWNINQKTWDCQMSYWEGVGIGRVK